MSIFSRKFGNLLLVGALLGIGSGAMAGEFKQGEVLVKYKANSIRTRTEMNTFYSTMGVKSVKHFTGMMRGIDQLVLNDGISVMDAVAALKKSSLVEYAQPNYIMRILPVTQAQAAAQGHAVQPEPCMMPGLPYPPGCADPAGGTPPGMPTSPGLFTMDNDTRPALQPAPADVNPPVADPDLDKAYGLSKVGATQAWTQFGGSKAFLLADIDTGIDYNHEDLAFNVWRNPNPTNNDIVGFDFIHNDGLPFDDNMHGTHTAGTIGAVGGNGKGISGVAPRVSIMAVKFLDSAGGGTAADAVRAIDYAVTHGAKVLSNSWGGASSPTDPDNQVMHDAVIRAQKKGVLFVAAAGNDSVDNDGDGASYPAAYPDDNVIAVAATDENDGMAYFSNYGKKSVHLGAPGLNVYSTVPGNQYKTESGTSMACPHVAGAAALIWAANPNLDYKGVKKALLDSVDPVASLADKTVTGGRLNVLKALKRARDQI